MVFFLALLAVWAVLVGVWIAAIVSASRFSAAAYTAAGRSQGGTVALVVITGWLGAAYYWLVIKQQVEPFQNGPPR